MIDVMRRIQPSPQHGENSMILFNFLFKKIILMPLLSVRYLCSSRFQKTQLVRQLNARQPITMRNDQGFHPLLHLRVSNCPISRFPFFQLIPVNVLKVKFAESFCITWVIKVISHCCGGSSSPMCSRAVPFAPQNHLWPQKKNAKRRCHFLKAKIQLPKHPGEKLTEQIPTRTVNVRLKLQSHKESTQRKNTI